MCSNYSSCGNSIIVTAVQEWAKIYNKDHDKFDRDFADAWFKLVHRSEQHPNEADLEADAQKCTEFGFLSRFGDAIKHTEEVKARAFGPGRPKSEL